MNEEGILGFGAYIPRKRLQRRSIYSANAWFAPGLEGLAGGERAVGNWDEDAVTMAVEAARDALSDLDRSVVKGLSIGSTTLPFANRLNSGIIKEALLLPDEVAAADITGTYRAGTTCLLHGLSASKAAGGPHLCVSSDMRQTRAASEAELIAGDAAAALLVGSGKPVARLIGTYTETFDFVDQFRLSTREFDYSWETRWIRDESYLKLVGAGLKHGLARLGIDPKKIDRLIVPLTARGVAEAIAKAAGLGTEQLEDTLSASVGEAGAAHSLLLLCKALETAAAGDMIAVLGVGQGFDLLVFEATALIDAPSERRGVAGYLRRRSEETNYLRWLAHRGQLDLDRGMRAEMDQKQPGTSLWRNRKTVLGLVGGRCRVTGAVQFPRSEISVSPNERTAGTQDDYPLAEKIAKVVSHTADNLAYSPDPPNLYGLIDFVGGGRMVAEFTDVDASNLAVGMEVRMVFRRKAVDESRGFIKYFWKATPVEQ